MTLMLTHRGDPAPLIARALADDPCCIEAHCLRIALIITADDDRARSTLAESIGAIEASTAENDPARRHARAARAWLDREPTRALERYGAIVIADPHDILALCVAHALDFRLGRRTMLRDRVAQVLPEWDARDEHCASVLAMYAFGLEENGEYRNAEKIARRALTIDPMHLGAVHVVAHVMEMQGRAREGLAFLAETEAAWPAGAGFSIHLAWHRALFHIDADDPIAALAVHDDVIANARPSISVLADASALLWRLELLGIEAGARWNALADRWEAHDLSAARPFFIVHAIMAFAWAGRTHAAARAFDALRRVQAGAMPAPEEEALAAPLTEAFIAFAHDDYAACIDWLVKVRHIADRCGGSVAQCDLIHLTYTEAALRAQADALARALVAERTALKPKSRLNRRFEQRLRRKQAA